MEVVHTLGVEATESVQPVTVHIPIITNAQAIASGDVLFLPRTAAKQKLPPPSKAQTWLTDLNRKLKAG